MPSRLALLAASLLALAASGTGCVERKLIVKPDPEDAVVFVDGHELSRDDSKPGESPTLRYEYYGIRRVVVRKEGYVAHEELVTLDPPWYQFFPIDLVFDVFLPFTVEDARTLAVKLEPRSDLTKLDAGEAVLERARGFAAQGERRP